MAKKYKKATNKGIIPTKTEDKIAALKATYMDFVDRNFLARCHFVQPYYDKNLKAIVRVVNDMNPPPAFAESLRFPPIAVNLDFRCVRAFVINNRPHVEFNELFCEEPLAVFYDDLLRLDLLDEFKAYRAAVYGAVFDDWAQENSKTIAAIDFNDLCLETTAT